jgi:hypothetical protein
MEERGTHGETLPRSRGVEAHQILCVRRVVEKFIRHVAWNVWDAACVVVVAVPVAMVVVSVTDVVLVVVVTVAMVVVTVAVVVVTVAMVVVTVAMVVVTVAVVVVTVAVMAVALSSEMRMPVRPTKVEDRCAHDVH